MNTLFTYKVIGTINFELEVQSTNSGAAENHAELMMDLESIKGLHNPLSPGGTRITAVVDQNVEVEEVEKLDE